MLRDVLMGNASSLAMRSACHALCYADSGGAATNSGTSDNASPDLSGTGSASVVANKTFVDANVNTTTNQITVTGHGFTAGFGVQITTTGVAPAPLSGSTMYYVGVIDANTLTLHTNMDDAVAGTNAIDITSAAGGGTHTINNFSVIFTGSPDFSAIIPAHFIFTATGTSHIMASAAGPHLLTTGDMVCYGMAQGASGTGGITINGYYFVDVLSPTTIRLHATKALALAAAGGASAINITGAGTRSIYLSQPLKGQAIRLASATNTSRKVFWIKGVNNTAKFLVVDQVVTGISGGSDWAIGGRVNAAGLVDLCNSVRAIDTVIFNTDISANPLVLSVGSGRQFGANGIDGDWGSPSLGGGACRFIGKPGARRVLANLGNGVLFTGSVSNSNMLQTLENMEIISAGTGAAFTGSSNWGCRFYDCVMSDSGGLNQIGNNLASAMIRTRWTTFGIAGLGSTLYMIESYMHDMGSTQTLQSGSTSTFVMINSIIERGPAGVQITQVSGSTFNTYIFYGNTFYRNDNSGYEETLHPAGLLLMLRNIFKDNGNAAGEYNIELPNDNPNRIIWSADNLFSIDGARGGGNLSNFTAGPLDLSGVDPLFVDPDNASQASRNFALAAASPGRNREYDYQKTAASLIKTFADIGAIQAQKTAGGGGGQRVIGA
jgi:hypothetical protein